MGTLGVVSIEGREVNIDTTSQSEYGFMTALNMVEYLVNSTTGGMALTDEKKDRAQTANYIQFAQQNLQGLVQAFKKWFSLNAQRKSIKKEMLEWKEWLDARDRGDLYFWAREDPLVKQARDTGLDYEIDQALADENNEANKSPYPRAIAAIDFALEAKGKVDLEGKPPVELRGYEEMENFISVARAIAFSRDKDVDSDPRIAAAEQEVMIDWLIRASGQAGLFANGNEADPIYTSLTRSMEILTEGFISYNKDRPNYSPDAYNPADDILAAAAKARALSRVSTIVTTVAGSDDDIIAANRAAADASARLFAALESGDTDAARVAAADFSRFTHEAAVLAGYTAQFPGLMSNYEMKVGGTGEDLDSVSTIISHVTAIADAFVAQLNAPPDGDAAPGAPPDPGGGAGVVPGGGGGAPGAPPDPGGGAGVVPGGGGGAPGAPLDPGGGGVPGGGGGGGVVPPPPPGGTWCQATERGMTGWNRQ
jgi:hypothetical protein